MHAARFPIRATAAVIAATALVATATVAAAPALAAPPSSIVAVGDLTVNARTQPLGIPGADPVFGWVSVADARDVTQTAYRIQVGSATGSADLWDSGKVHSDEQVDIAYPEARPDLESGTRYHWRVQVWDQDDRASGWSDSSWFETGLLDAADWEGAEWIGRPTGSTTPSKPIFRTEFTTDPSREIASARVYASARGVYELSLNGQKVGDQFLAPGYTDYRTRIQSQTYEVDIQPGTNAIGASVGDGWYAGWVADHQNVFGTAADLSVIVKMRIDYTTGDPQWVTTDDSWTWSPGPFESADRHYGETYNAGREIDGWNEPGFDDSAWRAVAVRASTTDRLVAQPDEPVRALQELPAPPTAAQPTAGARIFDLGQNISGLYRVELTGKPGETAVISYGESVYNDSYPVEQRGKLFTGSVIGTDRYTFPSDCVAPCTVTYTPTFTQHGYRYLQVSGLATLPGDGDVHGILLASDIERTGNLTTSDPMVNQLISNSYWSAIDNMLSIPTDCPQRGERVGYTGDINLFGPTAMYLLDGRSFLGKYADDLADAQNVTDDEMNGSMPSVVPYSQHIPRANGGPSVGWEDATIGVPYAVWHATRNVALVRKHWPMMEKFLSYSLGFVDADGVSDRLAYYGDWGYLNGRATPNNVLATAFTAENLRMMAEIAEAIDAPEADAYRDRLAEVRRGFTETFVAADGTVTGDAQTGYALALGMDLIDDPQAKAKAGTKFTARLAADGNHLATGFLGLPWLLPALSAIDRDDLAYQLLLNDDYPSWGYEVKMGATTIWEFWNTIAANGTLGWSSQNHYAFGSVTDWIHQSVGGIQIGDAGYRTSVVAPRPGGGITSATNTLETVYGTLSSAWELTADRFDLDVTVPVNTSTEVHLPAAGIAAATLDGAPLTEDAPGVHDLRYDADEHAVVLTLGSGSYQLSAQRPDLSVAGTAVDVVQPGLAEVTATVHNAGDAAAAVQVRATTPADSGLTAGAPSEITTVPAQSSVEIPVDVYFAADADAVNGSVDVEVVDDGAVLAKGSAAIAWSKASQPVVVPPATFSDRVDFGPSAAEVASQTAHNFAKSANAGTSVEAGVGRAYCRRIAGENWFSADVELPESGKPFALVMVETANATMAKDYRISVDGTEVSRVRYTPVVGLNNLAVEVDDLAGIDPDGDGRVTVRFAFTLGATPPPNVADCSISELWVTPLAAKTDTIAPSISAAPAPGAPRGDAGWHTGPVDVVVTAVDDVDLAAVQIDTGSGWTGYAEPVRISADGETTVRYRAVDTAGNTSGERSLLVKVDRTAPTVEVSGGPRGDVEASAVPPAPSCVATDATSGLRSCDITGYSTEVGEHTLTATAVDHAGNRATAAVDYRVVDRQSPTVTAVTSSRCIAGKATLSITATNAGATPVSIQLRTPYATRSFDAVAPGATVFHAFSTRLKELPAGTADVIATADGGEPSTTSVAYDARSCG